MLISLFGAAGGKKIRISSPVINTQELEMKSAFRREVFVGSISTGGK